jgi:hypothetical protein
MALAQNSHTFEFAFFVEYLPSSFWVGRSADGVQLRKPSSHAAFEVRGRIAHNQRNRRSIAGWNSQPAAQPFVALKYWWRTSNYGIAKAKGFSGQYGVRTGNRVGGGISVGGMVENQGCRCIIEENIAALATAIDIGLRQRPDEMAKLFIGGAA